MPVKKKSAKLPGKAKVKAAEAKAAGDGEHTLALAAEPLVLWITLSVRLVTWGYLNFAMRVPLTTRIFELRERIVDRHGGSIIADEVRIYKGDVSARNLINDLMLTLEDLDIGVGVGENDEEGGESVLFYDFKPVIECPLLLSEPPNYRFTSEAKKLAEVEVLRKAKEEARLQKRTISDKGGAR
ncbi:hypothetical protein T492DRAFT_1060932 [Pavlovales sp. CCMP2436]|nr:hypothetical protein T492DRAFT_1060932 [Pavlovales sp. CCMP2436]